MEEAETTTEDKVADTVEVDKVEVMEVAMMRTAEDGPVEGMKVENPMVENIVVDVSMEVASMEAENSMADAITVVESMEVVNPSKVAINNRVDTREVVVLAAMEGTTIPMEAVRGVVMEEAKVVGTAVATLTAAKADTATRVTTAGRKAPTLKDVVMVKATGSRAGLRTVAAAAAAATRTTSLEHTKLRSSTLAAARTATCSPMRLGCCRASTSSFRTST